MKSNLKKSGFVLISVLWITAMLTVITLGFGRRAAMDRRASAYSLDQTEAMMMARGAVDRGIVEITNRGVMQMLMMYENQGSTNLAEPWAHSKNLFEEGYFEQAEQSENDEVIYVITDEERYININTAPKELLEGIESMNSSLVRKIIARRTEEVHEKEGVSPFQAIEEIRYLQGVDEEDWFGERDKPGLKNLLTVWGEGKINLNTATPQVLECILNMSKSGIRESDLDAILAYRNGADGIPYTEDDQGFKSIPDVQEKTEVTIDPTGPLGLYCMFSSSYFRITGVATRRQGRIRAVCSAVVTLQDGPPVILDWQEKTLGS